MQTRPFESFESSLTGRLGELGFVDVEVVTDESATTPAGDARHRVVIVGVSAG